MKAKFRELSPAVLISQAITVVRFHLLEGYSSAESLRVFAAQLVPLLTDILARPLIVNLLKIAYTRFDNIRAEQLRDWVVDLFTNLERDVVEDGIAASQRLHQFRKEQGEILDPATEAMINTMPANIATTMHERCIQALKNLSLESWEEIRQGVLIGFDRLINKTKECLNGNLDIFHLVVWNMLIDIQSNSDKREVEWTREPLNRVLVTYIEGQFGWRCDREQQESLGILWDAGVRAGINNWSWSGVMSLMESADRENPEIRSARDKLENVLYSISDCLNNLVKNQELSEVFDIGVRRKLVPYLKSSTYNKRTDSIRGQHAKKRQGIEIPIPRTGQEEEDKNISYNEAIDDIVMRRRTALPERLEYQRIEKRIREAEGKDDGEVEETTIADAPEFTGEPQATPYQEEEARVALFEITRDPVLTDREKKLLIMEVKAAVERYSPLTLEELGEMMGISPVRVKQLRDSAYRKIRESQPNPFVD